VPYTEALREVPSFPSAQGKIVNPDGTPSREFLTFLRELEAWAERVQAALVELEPP
jgi:hypothetical protein